MDLMKSDNLSTRHVAMNDMQQCEYVMIVCCACIHITMKAQRMKTWVLFHSWNVWMVWQFFGVRIANITRIAIIARLFLVDISTYVRTYVHGLQSFHSITQIARYDQVSNVKFPFRTLLPEASENFNGCWAIFSNHYATPHTPWKDFPASANSLYFGNILLPCCLQRSCTSWNLQSCSCKISCAARQAWRCRGDCIRLL